MEIVVWPTGEIIKEPENAVAPDSMMWATTSASTLDKQSYDLLDTISVGPSLGEKKSGMAKNIVKILL